MTVQALANLPLAELFHRWPPTLTVFQQCRLACVGCAMAPFCTVEDTIRSYALDREAFLCLVLRAVEGAEARAR